MKILIIILLILNALIASLIYSQSNITYSPGTGIEIQAGADVCADEIIINGVYSGTGTICTGPLPVTISSFTANVNKQNVQLNWITETEINNSGFGIERKISTEREEWKKIAFVPGSGTSNGPKSYSFEDRKLNTGNYKYRLKQIDFNGNHEYFELENFITVNPPQNFSISQNYPNPSNPKCKIDYELPSKGSVSIKLYNLIGQEVFIIVNEVKDAGYYTAEFNGTNLASGVYFYIFLADGYSTVKKMVLIK